MDKRQKKLCEFAKRMEIQLGCYSRYDILLITAVCNTHFVARRK